MINLKSNKITSVKLYYSSYDGCLWGMIFDIDEKEIVRIGDTTTYGLATSTIDLT